MINLTQADLLAMRACIEVAEPSVDDTGPMEIWTRAMDAIKKIEDYQASLDKSQSQWAPDSSWFGDEQHTDSNLHPCTYGNGHLGLCGLTAVAKYEDGINAPEYLCKQHYNDVRSASADPDTDCGWSMLDA